MFAKSCRLRRKPASESQGRAELIDVGDANLIRRIVHFVPLILCAAWVIGLASLLEFRSGERIDELKSRVAEYVLVQHDGLRLGQRPASSDIVLVLYDEKTATALTPFRSYKDDVNVYDALCKAGAAVVYDSRNIAVSGEQVLGETQILLDGLVRLSELSQNVDRAASKSRLFLDAWMAAKIGETDMSRYSGLVTLNPLSVQPHFNAYQRVRLYPLGMITSFGDSESTPLTIYRAFHGMDRPSAQILREEFERSGILSEQLKRLSSSAELFNDPPSDFRLLDEHIPWRKFAASDISVFPVGFEVSHDPRIDSYRRISFVDVLKSEDPRTLDIEGKIVLIGYVNVQDPADDSYELPGAPGKRCAAEMVALATQTLLDKRWLMVPSDSVRLSIIIVSCIGVILLAYWLKPIAAIALTLTIVLAYFGLAVYLYRVGWKLDFVIVPVACFLAAIQGGALAALVNHRAHTRVVDLFGRYVPRAVVNQLILQSELESLRLGGTKREVTVLFADIRGFTVFAESLSPDQVVAELNSMLQVMVECTFEYQGTLDKFIGDAILVLFNAPLNQPDHIARAVKMSLEMQARLAKRSTQLSIGIGIHVGEAIVGNIGTPERMEYTAIGSTVNLASRLCDVATGGQVVISKQVYENISDQFKTDSIGPVKVKGISEPIEVWAIKA